MSPSDLTSTAVSTEASGTTYLLRRLALLLVVALGAALATLAATDRLDTIGLGSLAGRDATTSADAASETDATTSGDDPRSARASGGTSATTEPEPAAPDAAPDEAMSPISVQADSEADAKPAAPAIGAAPARAGRLVAQAPERVLDTRGPDGSSSAPDPGATQTFGVPPERTAVALSVSLLGAERGGSVIVDGRAGAVEAVAVGGAGGTVTNLVIIPVVGEEVTVRNSAGGQLVVDVVATFESAPTGSASGRFVAIEPTRIAELETAVDGDQAALALDQAVPAEGPSAVLVMVTADVGADGGVVRLGPAQESYDQMLMWGPTGENRQRRGLVLLEPTTDGTAALLYDGGTVLTVDVVGYFTGDEAALELTGLYVPSGPRLLYSGPLGPDVPVQLGGVEPGAGRAVATVASRSADAGRLWSVTTPVVDGRIEVGAAGPVEADVTLLGVFIG